MEMPKTGDTLPNGAVVMMFHEKNEGGIVLAYNAENKEFATWDYVATGDSKPFCVSGWYYSDVLDGIACYLRRTEQAKQMLDAIEDQYASTT